MKLLLQNLSALLYAFCELQVFVPPKKRRQQYFFIPEYIDSAYDRSLTYMKTDGTIYTESPLSIGHFLFEVVQMLTRWFLAKKSIANNMAI